MSKLTHSKVKTPNARLLYRESYGLALDWNFHESKISQFVKTNNKIKLANNATLLYFFSSPDEEDFSLASSWIAREIIGITSELPDEFQVYDIDAGEAHRFILPLTSIKDFLAESILTFHQTCVEFLENENIKAASSWRVGIASIFNEQETKLEVWLDFFEDGDEANCN